MLGLYKRATAVFLVLFALTLAVAYLCYRSLHVEESLLPAQDSTLPWTHFTLADSDVGGGSTIEVEDATYSLDFNYTIEKVLQYPTVTFVLAFDEVKMGNQLVDLSPYYGASLKVKCSHDNLLAFDLHTLDPVATVRDDFSTYRISQSLFSCDNQWRAVNVDLPHMTVPVWWLDFNNLEASSQNYQLDQVMAFSIGASRRGPVGIPSNVKVSEFVLKRRDWRYAYLFAALFVTIWMGYAFWLFRQYTQYLIANVKEKLQRDRPLIAYQQLSIQPHKNKEKSQILRFMATEYANTEMSLEYAVSELGINRTKINEVLKEEMGLTFTTYLNKIRLAEAARLLAESEDANIAEIAYSVGYKNVSYFNKLFKSEYGCTPKSFKSLDSPPQNDESE